MSWRQARLLPPLRLVMNTKERALRHRLQELQSLVVAYSGGVDSSLLAKLAKEELGERALVVIAVSPSLASNELRDARQQAQAHNFDLLEISTEEVDKPEYQANTGNRCFFCKATLFEHLTRLKDERQLVAIVYGANMDDLSDTRPGHLAAKQAGVLAPFIDCQVYKSDIREMAAGLGLSSFDRPQAACLSSRFPDFTIVSAERLRQVESAEEIVRSYGFRQLRVRFIEDVQRSSAGARLEVGADELSNLTAPIRTQIADDFVALGFASTEFDETGYSQGKANVRVSTNTNG